MDVYILNIYFLLSVLPPSTTVYNECGETIFSTTFRTVLFRIPCFKDFLNLTYLNKKKFKVFLHGLVSAYSQRQLGPANFANFLAVPNKRGVEISWHCPFIVHYVQYSSIARLWWSKCETGHFCIMQRSGGGGGGGGHWGGGVESVLVYTLPGQAVACIKSTGTHC